MKGGSFYIPQTKKEGLIMKELQYYENIKDWDFSQINYLSESYTNWELYDELKKVVTKDSKVLDLGTGGGEKLLEFLSDNEFPNATINDNILSIVLFLILKHLIS